MPRLHEQLRDWLARAEILARGGERLRADAARALAEGRPGVARSLALAILEDLPRSPVALALWADAAEAMMLDPELVEALERLAGELPFRADVWQRLASARHRAGVDVGDALERAIEAREPIEAADAARLWLSDRDLAAGDPARAERWLAGLSLGAQASREAVLRRVEVLLELGEHERAEQVAAALGTPEVLDGRAWLVWGRLLTGRDPGRATQAFERALMLRTPGASRLACDYVRKLEDPREVDRIAAVALSEGLVRRAEWQAALALARGHATEALKALAESVTRDGDLSLLQRWIDLATDLRDADALRAAVAAARAAGQPISPGVSALATALEASEVSRQLDALDAADGAAESWADALRLQAYRRWLPGDGNADWPPLLDELRSLARAMDALDAVREAEAISVELAHPLTVAVVGEFNTGKSSFVNALLGEAVAPVGVLPTTASPNRLAWAPDRLARITFRKGAADRVTTHSGLRDALRELPTSRIAEVTIYAPIEPLRRIELLDTPGFNAPDAAHAGRAREALSSAHVALWLLDAAQPLKESERALLSEAAGLGTPLVVLVNKSDRMADASALEAVLAHVGAGLRDAGIVPLIAPFGFSARQALLGLHDAEALARSGWARVDALVNETLVPQSERLRDLALRRRAASVAQRLAERAAAIGDERQQRATAHQAERTALQGLVARFETLRPSLETALRGTIHDQQAELRHTLRPLVGRRSTWTEAERRFLRTRVRALLGPVLATQAAVQCGLPPDLARRVEVELEPRLSASAAALGAELLASDLADEGASAPDLAVLASEELERVLVHLRDGPGEIRTAAPEEVRAGALAGALMDRAPPEPAESLNRATDFPVGTL